MRTYEPMCGEMVSETARRMVELAKRTRDSVEAKFNDIELTATPDSTADAITSYYSEESARRAEAYHNSPEGKRAARESEERRRRMQQKHDALMQQLPNLDFTNDVAVLDWLCAFQDPSDYIGVVKQQVVKQQVVKQQDVVLATFAAHGYHPSVNCGKNFNENDRDNFARWLIGQALDGLQGEVGAIHQVIHKFADDWKKKFLAAAH